MKSGIILGLIPLSCASAFAGAAGEFERGYRAGVATCARSYRCILPASASGERLGDAVGIGETKAEAIKDLLKDCDRVGKRYTYLDDMNGFIIAQCKVEAKTAAATCRPI